MSGYSNICLNCMHDKGTEKVCPYCGSKGDIDQPLPYLPLKTVVADRYLIGKAAGRNGDGADYLAWDIQSKKPVSVREFMPDGIFRRNMKTLEIVPEPGCEDAYADAYAEFLDLWRKLARMRGLSALILVIDIVEDHGTAYAVSEYFEDTTLRDYLLAGKTGYLSWEEARILLMPVLSTLSTLHSAGIIHRGISPETLMVGSDRKVRISGFSISAARTAKSGIEPQIFAGYAPIEQYGFDGQQGPWTDIYAYAAVLYRVLVGSVPIDATVRITNDKMMIPAKFAEQIPAYVINALTNALQILPEDRTRTVEEFRSELSAAPSVTVNAPKLTRPAVKKQPEPKVQKKPEHAGNNIVVKDRSKDKSAMKTGLKYGIAAAAVILVIFIILCFTVLKDHLTSAGGSSVSTTAAATVSVPDFSGRSYASVSTQKAYVANFKITPKYVYSTQVAKGYIISQNVPAGTNVEVGSTIILNVSNGVQQIKLPDVTGYVYEDAQKTLTDAGFKVTKADKFNDGTHTGNTVVSMSLESGKSYDKGTEVILQVWSDVTTTTVDPANVVV